MSTRPYRLPPGHHEIISHELLPWFDASARSMPWREKRDPYRVWVSETMLQQTRVDTVTAYYQRWMRQFPDLPALAAADLQSVLKVWEGLGYYARARNLHAGAREVMEHHGGEIPREPDALLALRGIGPYTQAAILSLAFNESFAVLDGNVERVLTRLCGIGDDIRKSGVKKRLRDLAQRLLSTHPPARFNEALMELGATVCTPRAPDCAHCPLRARCRAFRRGDPERFPVKSPGKPIPTVHVGAGVVWKSDSVFLVAQRRPDGMLGGLWEFPGGKIKADESVPDCVERELEEELNIRVEVGRELMVVRHTYSHFHLHMTVYHCRWRGDPPWAVECADFRWVTLSEARELPFSRADLKILDRLQAELKV